MQEGLGLGYLAFALAMVITPILAITCIVLVKGRRAASSVLLVVWVLANYNLLLSGFACMHGCSDAPWYVAWSENIWLILTLMSLVAFSWWITRWRAGLPSKRLVD